jgi:sigma-B regulation protein RsbU (phosphoserine phosphatase)
VQEATNTGILPIFQTPGHSTMPFSDLPNNDVPLQVLLVEDSLPYAHLVTAQLKRSMDRAHVLTHVDRVAPAVNRLGQAEFDLVILDMHLPDSAGLETFQSVYAAAREVPIAILSSDDSVELAINCVKAGAQDYLIKGDDDAYKLIRSLRFAIERRRRLHAEQELDAARLIQQSLLPDSDPTIVGFNIAGTLEPATETAGDYYDFLIPMPAGDGAIGIAVADVSGHGLGPAMVMSETRAALNSFCCVESDLGRILVLTNNVLLRSRHNHFVTLALASVHPGKRTLTYAAAGHPSWHISADGTATELPGSGPPLGIIPMEKLPELWTTSSPLHLAAGDVVLLMTDGSAEARSDSGEMFGYARVLEIVRNHQSEPSAEIVHHLRDAANDRKTGRTNKTIRGARRRTVLTSVLESLRLSLPDFTLGHVLNEVTAWLATGRSRFRQLLESQNLPPPQSHPLDSLLPVVIL